MVSLKSSNSEFEKNPFNSWSCLESLKRKKHSFYLAADAKLVKKAYLINFTKCLFCIQKAMKLSFTRYFQKRVLGIQVTAN